MLTTHANDTKARGPDGGRGSRPLGRRGLFLAAAVIAVFSWLTASAKPPAPPPPPAGSIYYQRGSDLYSMDGNGENATLVLAGFLASGLDDETKASVHIHGGHRWFLTFLPVGEEIYPDGLPRVELCAVSDAGQTFQLSDDSTLQPNHDGWHAHHVQWSNEDTRVSWLARRWGAGTDGSPAIVEWGIYTVDLDRDVALGPNPRAPARVPIGYPSYVDPDGGLLWPDFEGFDWSPDETRVVFASNGVGLFVADAGTGATTQLIADVVTAPRWSPDGSAIAFRVYPGGIDTIAPDGSGRLRIVYDKYSRFWDINYEYPVWSPDSQHVAFRRLAIKTNNVNPTVDVYRVPAAGGTEIRITPLTGPGTPFDWVPQE
jgi:hypothetical protein